MFSALPGAGWSVVVARCLFGVTYSGALNPSSAFDRLAPPLLRFTANHSVSPFLLILPPRSRACVKYNLSKVLSTRSRPFDNLHIHDGLPLSVVGRPPTILRLQPIGKVTVSGDPRFFEVNVESKSGAPKPRPSAEQPRGRHLPRVRCPTPSCGYSARDPCNGDLLSSPYWIALRLRLGCPLADTWNSFDSLGKLSLDTLRLE